MWADTLSFELLKENMCKQNLYFGVILRVCVSVSSQTAESFGMELLSSFFLCWLLIDAHLDYGGIIFPSLKDNHNISN